MKVAVLGGGGYEGSIVADILANQADVEKVILADRNQKRAEAVAQRLGTKVEARFADVNDHTGLVTLLNEVEAVVNTVGPFFLHGTKALNAAIKARKNYIDITDDYDITRQLLALDKEAKSAGITALINMGASPGLLNVLSRYGADKLDQVEEIHVSWCAHYVGGKGGPSAGLHAFRIMDGNVPQYLDGKWVDVPAGSGREIVEFPAGPIECFYVGHPEPLTLPIYIEDVKTVTNKGAVLPSWVSEDMFKMLSFGLGSMEPIKIKGDTFVIPIEVALRLQAMYLAKKDLGKAQGGYKTEVIGMKDGNRITYIYDLPPQMSSEEMSSVTARPAAAGALTVVRGDFNEKGVFPPEVLDAKRFLKLVAELGIDCYETQLAPQPIEL